MCMMCDGYSLDEVLALQAAHLDVEQFLVQPVGSPDGPFEHNWAYTVGLIESVGHDELIVAGADVELSYRLLMALGEAVLDGDRFEVGDRLQFGDVTGDVGFVAEVAPVQYQLETFNVWHNLESYGALTHGPLKAVQIIVPSHWDEVGTQPILSDPAARVDGAWNREARRAQQRPRGRRRRR
jgi:hypothetical protein